MCVWAYLIYGAELFEHLTTFIDNWGGPVWSRAKVTAQFCHAEGLLSIQTIAVRMPTNVHEWIELEEYQNHLISNLTT